MSEKFKKELIEWIKVIATALVFALTILKELGYINEMEDIEEGMLVNLYNKYGK